MPTQQTDRELAEKALCSKDCVEFNKKWPLPSGVFTHFIACSAETSTLEGQARMRRVEQALSRARLQERVATLEWAYKSEHEWHGQTEALDELYNALTQAKQKLSEMDAK